MREVVVIPARLDSIRFPKKILFDIKGLPMLEHDRRRVLLSKKVDDVYIATCDYEIKNAMESFGAKVIMTSTKHLNGTSRVAEAIENIDCENVILVQGDEPLILPNDIDYFINSVINSSNIDAWNATGPIVSCDELFKETFVNCIINNDRISNCFRKTSFENKFQTQKKSIRKILGLIAFQKKFLKKLVKLSPTPTEISESIEQMRIIENGYNIKSIPFELSQPSVNKPDEIKDVIKYFKNNYDQQLILKKVLEFNNLE